MRERFDRRVVPDALLELLQALARREEVHLAGGLALSGAHLGHRLSDDVDLFVHDTDTHRRAIHHLHALIEDDGGSVEVVQHAGPMWRAELTTAGGLMRRVDLVHERVRDLAPTGDPVEGVLVESFEDLRASKVTCLLSRSEPRDLVDVLFLERRGFPPEADLALALKKDGGIDPGTLAWLLARFPTSPLPRMLEPLTEEELRVYRDELAERMRRLAMPQ